MNIISRIYAEWCVIAFQKNIPEKLDIEFRQYLADLDACIRDKKTEKTMNRLKI